MLFFKRTAPVAPCDPQAETQALRPEVSHEVKLWNAAYDGEDDRVRLMLHMGADCNWTNTIGSTPLYIAAQKGHLTVVTTLLDARANLHQTRTKDGATPLYISAQEGHSAVVTALLANGANVEQAMTDGTTPLYIAAQEGHLGVVAALLTGGADVEHAMTDGTTPLYIAAQEGHLAVVAALLNAGADFDQPMTDGTTALYIAAQEGHSAVVAALLNAGADFDQATTDGATPLFIAAKKGDLVVVATLLKAGANVNQKKISGATPLFIAAQKGHSEVVAALLNAGADIYQATTDGATPLFIAAQQGHLTVVLTLLEAGADFNQGMTDGATPLYTAILFGHFEVVQALFRHQEAVMPSPQISIATEYTRTECVKYLLSDESVRDYYLDQIITKPELMRHALAQHPVFFDELASHRKAIWRSLQAFDRFDLTTQEYKALLKAILDSRQASNVALQHPLYALFDTPPLPRRGFFSCCRHTQESILDEIQAINPDSHISSMKTQWTH